MTRPKKNHPTSLRKLTKLERIMYRRWRSDAASLDTARDLRQKADLPDLDQRKAELEMYVAAADASYNEWLTICDAVDEVEQALLNGFVMPEA